MYVIETFEERCEREFHFGYIRQKIQEKNEEYIKKCERQYKESLFLPLLCDIIAMEYLPHKNIMGKKIHTSRKLPKPIQKLNFEHEGKKYNITNFIKTRLDELKIPFEFNAIEKAIVKLNVQKTRQNKYLYLDKIR